jgi:hypothetical protein
MILMIGFAPITSGCASHSRLVTDAGSKIHLMYEFTKPDAGKTALAVNVYRSGRFNRSV